MKKRLTTLAALFCLLCLLVTAVPSLADHAHTLPLEILSVTPGEQASFTFINHGDIDITTASFRTRGYTEDGSVVYFFTADLAEGGKVYMDLTRFDGFIGPMLHPEKSAAVEVSDGYQAIFSDVLEVAVQQYTTLDGRTYRIPESQLCWFSSKDGYPEGTVLAFDYDYPDRSVFQKSYSFGLGLSIDRIYPELAARHGLTRSGYLVTAVSGGLLAAFDVREGDLIWALNGLQIIDDPCALEKAKAALTDGTDMVLSILRDGEEITVTVPPSALEANKE